MNNELFVKICPTQTKKYLSFLTEDYLQNQTSLF